MTARILATLFVLLAVVFGAYQWIQSTPGDPGREISRSLPPLSESTVSKGNTDAANRARNAATNGSQNGSLPRRDGLPVVDLDGVTSIQEILDQLGINRDFAEWARSRGYKWGFGPDPNMTSDPYAGLSVEELEQLSEAGDLNARLALAGKLRGTDPARALELYASLAENGMLNAMGELGAAYAGAQAALANPQGSALPPSGIEALRGMANSGVDFATEAIAWQLLFDSYMGYPRQMGDPTAGDPWEAFAAACQRAIELQRLVAQAAAINGESLPNLVPAPFGIGPLESEGVILEACPPTALPTADFGACQRVMVYVQGEYFEGFVCP